jgi:hypothetical protein
LAAVLIGFIFLAPACGGSSSTTEGSGAGTESGAASGSENSKTDTATSDELSAEQCQELAGRWQNLVAGPATAVGGGTEDAASLRTQIDARTHEIPEQISAAFAVFASSTEKVLELMNGYGGHSHPEGEDHPPGEVVTEPAPADVDARLQAVAEVTGSAAVTDALAQIEAYFGASCPAA